MSKSILVVMLAIGVLGSSNAFASRAREAVLGTGDAGLILNGGSFFYDEDYNIFYNPSFVNDYKNWAIVEKASVNSGNAQGGFFTSVYNFNLGVYLNRGNAVYDYSSYSNPATTRPIEIYLGSDMGVKWGVGLTLASNSVAAGTSNDTELNLGAQVAGLEPFATIKLSGNEEPSGGTKIEHKGFRVGARYKWGEWIPYAAYVNLKNTPTGGTEEKKELFGIGLGRSTKLSEGTKLNYSLAYIDSKTTTTIETKRGVIPVDLSFEGEANTWLTIRAGVSYKLFDKSNGSTGSDTTTGRIGAGFHLGKADLDMAVGSTAGTENIDGPTFDSSNGLFSLASLTYRW